MVIWLLVQSELSTLFLVLIGLPSLLWLHVIFHARKHYANSQNLDLHIVTSSHAKIDYCCLTSEPTQLYLNLERILFLVFIVIKVVFVPYFLLILNDAFWFWKACRKVSRINVLRNELARTLTEM